MTISPGYRFEATQALRQVLARAVVWGMIDVNPAKHGVDNPQRRRTEKRPFESWAQLDALAARLGPRYGPLVLFAAATGLRPGEWIALEQRDIDRDARVVYVRRAYTQRPPQEHRRPKRSLRAVPLQAIALAALDQLADRARLAALCSRPPRRLPRPPQLPQPPLEARPDRGGHRRRRAASTISVTRSQLSRSVPASQPSTSRATWEPA